MRWDNVETFTNTDWAKYFRSRVRHLVGIPVATPTSVLARSFDRLLQDFENNHCLLAVVLDDLLSGENAFVHQVGPNDGMLTLGVIHRATRERGGYAQHWKALYYRRFAQTADEVEYFIKYLALLDDAKTASPGTAAKWGGITFMSWHDVEKLATLKLDKACGTIKWRFQVSGPQEEGAVQPLQLPPTLVPPLVEKVRQALKGTRIIRG